MKSYNHLYEKLIDLDNIVTAIHNASKRKKRRHEVQAVIDNPWHHAHNVVAMLERENLHLKSTTYVEYKILLPVRKGIL